MRWTDVPGDGRQADGRDSAEHRRAQWAELRQRLERLPPGHPSSPEQDEPDATGEPDTAGEADATGQPDAAGEADVTGQPDAAGEADATGQPDAAGEADGFAEPAGAGRAAGGRGHAGDGYLATGGQDQGLIGRHDPYRPWFTDGEMAQPWFADESS